MRTRQGLVLRFEGLGFSMTVTSALQMRTHQDHQARARGPSPLEEAGQEMIQMIPLIAIIVTNSSFSIFSFYCCQCPHHGYLHD